MAVIVFDIETDSLNPTKIWCLCAMDLETGQEYNWTFHDLYWNHPPMLEGADVVIGHNIGNIRRAAS